MRAGTDSGSASDDVLDAVERYTSYFGPYVVDEARGFVSQRIAGSLNPRLTGGRLEPFYEFEADQLALMPGSAVPRLVCHGSGVRLRHHRHRGAQCLGEAPGVARYRRRRPPVPRVLGDRPGRAADPRRHGTAGRAVRRRLSHLHAVRLHGRASDATRSAALRGTPAHRVGSARGDAKLRQLFRSVHRQSRGGRLRAPSQPAISIRAASASTRPAPSSSATAGSSSGRRSRRSTVRDVRTSVFWNRLGTLDPDAGQN